MWSQSSWLPLVAPSHSQVILLRANSETQFGTRAKQGKPDVEFPHLSHVHPELPHLWEVFKTGCALHCFRYALPGSQGTHTCIARLPARCSCSGSPNQPGLPSVPSRSGQVDQHLFNKHGTKGRPVEKKRIAAPVGRGSVHPCLNRLAPRHTCLCPPG